jgi:NitT/TauT family transport system substrate-binding protein
VKRKAALALIGTAALTPLPVRAADQVKVGLLPISAVAPLYLGIKKMFFADENIDVVPVVFQGGAALVPALMNGDVMFGFANVVSLLLASSRGLPMRAVANGATTSHNPTIDATAVIVPGNSPVKGPKDLEGRIVAVDTLGSIGELTVRNALEKGGADLSKVRFVEVPFPEMLGALAGGRIDAAYESEPFLTLGSDQKMRVLFYPYYLAVPGGFSVTLYVTSKAYATNNAALLARFQRALNRSLEYAAHAPADARATVLEYTKIAPDVANRMILPEWSPRVNPASIGAIADLMVRYAFVKTRPDVTALGLGTLPQ